MVRIWPRYTIQRRLLKSCIYIYTPPGITFAAQLQFGGIPHTPTSNPFATTPARSLTNNITASPFTALPNSETDLCLSLESMRGRKTLKVRGVVELPPDDELEGADDSMGVHVYVLRLGVSDWGLGS